jgi:type II secretion system protein N
MARVSLRPNIPFKLLLGLYALLCLVFFTWIRFPCDALRPRMENALSSALGIPVGLGHVVPSLTGGLVVKGVEIHGTPIAKKLRITPRPWEALRGVIGLGYHAEMLSGEVKGGVDLPTKMSSRPMDVSVEMAEVDLGKLAAVFPPSWRPAGILSGEVRIASPGRAVDKTVGSMSLSWKKGRLPLGMPSLPFDALTFDTMELEGAIEKGLMKIERGEFSGEFSGSLAGTVRLGKDVRRSRINVTGELNLPEAMRTALGQDAPSPGQPLRFSLRGTMEMPRFRILGSRAGRLTVARQDAQYRKVLQGGQPAQARAAERAARVQAQAAPQADADAMQDRGYPQEETSPNMQNAPDLEEE